MLAELIHEHEPTARFTHLYGTCHWLNRYNASTQGWRTEMTSIAETLGYNGPISGYDLSSWHSSNPFAKPAFNRIRGEDFSYVEYRVLAGAHRCAIYFKRMEKMNTTQGPLPASAVTSRVRPVALTPGTYERTGLVGNIAITAAGVRSTSSNQGELHRVPEPVLHSFQRTSAP
jgi:hypothetical protein